MSISFYCLSLLLLLNLVRANPVSDLQVSLPAICSQMLWIRWVNWFIIVMVYFIIRMLFPSEFEATFRRGEQRRTISFLWGDGGRGKRWKHIQVSVWFSRAPMGLFRLRQFSSCSEGKRPRPSLQRPDEDLKALVEQIQEGRAEELLRSPAGEDRLL